MKYACKGLPKFSRYIVFSKSPPTKGKRLFEMVTYFGIRAVWPLFRLKLDQSSMIYGLIGLFSLPLTRQMK